mmetsp:Transcript_28048/g.24779  ORF Transcript_28048/g.24779 Transcript_28048/m.24779 type:complete len:118 (-) Transcript_28048:402-755(-)
MFILKEGNLDVLKIIKIQDANYWPVDKDKWECHKTNQNFRKSVFKIIPLQFLALQECLEEIPISSTISSKSNSTLLCINKNDILAILSKEEVFNLLKSSNNVHIPEQNELIKKAVVN